MQLHFGTTPFTGSNAEGPPLLATALVARANSFSQLWVLSEHLLITPSPSSLNNSVHQLQPCPTFKHTFNTSQHLFPSVTSS